MNITSETKLFIGIIVVTIVIIFGAMLIFSKPEKTYTKEELIPQGTMTLGNTNAPNFLVEFSDYQCPSCKAFQPTVDAINETYKDSLLFAYRNFPLPQHPLAKKTAYAALSASIQGKYWEMHTYLFDHQEELSDTIIQKGGETLNLNMNQFLSDMNQSSISALVDKDITDGTTLNINATPTFFLNGKRLTLNSYEDLKNEVTNIMSVKK
jgi:protein-disulfide isomerase